MLKIKTKVIHTGDWPDGDYYKARCYRCKDSFVGPKRVPYCFSCHNETKVEEEDRYVLDLIGRKIREGSTIAYPTKHGSSSPFNEVRTVHSVNPEEGTLKVGTKGITLYHPERCVLLENYYG